jgi:ABC-type transport system involved in multi-copper enzyme maturation permease subunit
LNGTLAVARYTLVELSRRRILLVFFIIGAVGIALIGAGLKVFSGAFSSIVVSGPNGQAPDPAKLQRAFELGFVNNLIDVLGFFALLIAFGIGMTVIYHDLESGAAIAIFSKPISRAGFTIGKLAAALVAMVAIVGLLGLEARLVMLLFGTGGLGGALWVEMVAQVANAVTVMLLVMALSTWMNNIVAAIVAFVYNAVAGFVVLLHTQLAAGNLGDNQFLKVGLNIAYWLVPHSLMSDAKRQIALAQYELFSSINPPPAGSGNPAPTADQIVGGIPGASGAGEIIWWVFVVCLFAGLVYYAVRRRQV